MKKINLILILIAIIGSGYIAFNRDGNVVLLFKDLSILITITLPYIIEKLFHKKISTELKFIYILFVFSAHFLGVTLELYNSVEHFDKLNHWISGGLVALFTLPILKSLNIYDKKKKMANIILMIAFSLAVAALWEIFEYSASVFFDVDPQLVAETGVTDTMQDIIVAFIGSIMVSIWYRFTNKEKVIDNLANGVK